MADSFFPGKKTAALGPIVLLSGPPSWYCTNSTDHIPHPPIPPDASRASSGKTSLLFQFAFNRCMENSGTVVFICSKQRLESKPPFLAQGVDPSSEVFHRVHMKYVDDYEGIKKYFAAFHLHDIYPSAVVVDDFGDFFDDRNCQLRYGNARGRDMAVSRTLALCHETMKQVNLLSEGNCKLLLSDTYVGDGPRLIFLYKRWISCLFTITGDGFGSYIIKTATIPSGRKEEKTTTAKYSIALQYLVLEGVSEE